MTLAELRTVTETLAKWLAATTTLVFAFSRFLPTGQPGGWNIVDDPWIHADPGNAWELDTRN